jgi:hypothetical protein
VTAPLWITYAWVDNKEGDFDYLISELQAAGVVAKFDKVALVPGQRLWDQIAKQITEGAISGWAYLVTPQSIASEPCREELAYALDRALRARDESFPLIGLLRDVAINDVPAAIRVRLCIDLRDPAWAQAVVAAIEGRPPRLQCVG